MRTARLREGGRCGGVQRRGTGCQDKKPTQSPTPHRPWQGGVGSRPSAQHRASSQLTRAPLTGTQCPSRQDRRGSAQTPSASLTLLGFIRFPPPTTQARSQPLSLCLTRGPQGGALVTPHGLGAAEAVLSLMMWAREEKVACDAAPPGFQQVRQG